MKYLIKTICLLSVTLVILPQEVLAIDVLKADQYLKTKQYDLAKQEYIDAADIGNPYAAYQAGYMYFKGLGGKKDPINALIYLSVAADYKFYDAEKLVKGMLQRMPKSDRNTVKNSLKSLVQIKGQKALNEKYLPKIDKTTLGNTLTFNGKPTLEITDDFMDQIEDEINSANEISEDEELGEFGNIMQSPAKPYLIVDFDLAVDGSVRNISYVQKNGNAKPIIDSFEQFPLDKASYKGSDVEFAGRVYLGKATYSKFTLIKEDEKLYREVLLLAKKLKSGVTLKERYEYAMILLNFSWLKQEDNEVELLLKSLAQDGHPSAMYEYGFMLYREQRDIPTAIHWISEASKYGLSRAEYRLGQILLTSPWVEHSEKKALFWFESALEKDNDAATLKTIELRLTAKDTSLHNVELAVSLLSNIADTQTKNPQYFYLLAQSHRNRKDRDFTEVVENLERAIMMGQRTNWDVSEWQSLLTQLTTGSVYIQD